MAGYPQHADAAQILQKLRQERIGALFHFTSVENLPCIARLGALCSKATLQQRGMWPCADPGGNELSHSLDARNDNWDKLSVYWTPNTPMAYRKKRAKHLCF